MAPAGSSLVLPPIDQGLLRRTNSSPFQEKTQRNGSGATSPRGAQFIDTADHHQHEQLIKPRLLAKHKVSAPHDAPGASDLTAHQEGSLRCQPSIVRFAGFETGKTVSVHLKILNAGHAAIRLRINPNTTSPELWLSDTASYGPIVPGKAQTLTLHFKPSAQRYYFDTVHLTASDGSFLAVPIHAFPTLPATSPTIPRTIDFGAQITKQSYERQVTFGQGSPVTFEYELLSVDEHPNITITPQKGWIAKDVGATLTIHFAPGAPATARALYELQVAQFEWLPSRFEVIGRGVLHLPKKQEDGQAKKEIVPAKKRALPPTLKSFVPERRAPTPTTDANRLTEFNMTDDAITSASRPDKHAMAERAIEAFAAEVKAHAAYKKKKEIHHFHCPGTAPQSSAPSEVSKSVGDETLASIFGVEPQMYSGQAYRAQTRTRHLPSSTEDHIHAELVPPPLTGADLAQFVQQYRVTKLANAFRSVLIQTRLTRRLRRLKRLLTDHRVAFELNEDGARKVQLESLQDIKVEITPPSSPVMVMPDGEAGVRREARRQVYNERRKVEQEARQRLKMLELGWGAKIIPERTHYHDYSKQAGYASRSRQASSTARSTPPADNIEMEKTPIASPPHVTRPVALEDQNLASFMPSDQRSAPVFHGYYVEAAAELAERERQRKAAQEAAAAARAVAEALALERLRERERLRLLELELESQQNQLRSGSRTPARMIHSARIKRQP